MQNPSAQPGFSQTHRLVHSMDGKRRVNVPAPEPSIADTLGRFIKSSSARVLRPHGINFVAVRSFDHRVRSFPLGETGRTSAGSPQCGSASGTAVFTSDLAIIATKRMNRRNN